MQTLCKWQADLIIDLQLNQTVGSYHPIMSGRLNSVKLSPFVIVSHGVFELS